MSVKSARRPAKPRKASPEPAEVKVPVPGHALGDRAWIGMRRKAGLWAVLDSNRGERGPDYWTGREWKPLYEGTPDAEAYCWSKERARELVDRFVAEAAEIHEYYRDFDAKPTTAEVIAQLQRIEAHANQGLVGHLVRRVDPAATDAPVAVSTPAPKDVLGFGVTSDTSAETVTDNTLASLAESDADEELLTALGRSIPGPANTEHDTVLLDTSRLHGPEVTAELPAAIEAPPVRAAIPPKPKFPPLVPLPEGLPLEPVPPASWGASRARAASCRCCRSTTSRTRSSSRSARPDPTCRPRVQRPRGHPDAHQGEL